EIESEIAALYAASVIDERSCIFRFDRFPQERHDDVVHAGFNRRADFDAALVFVFFRCAKADLLSLDPFAINAEIEDWMQVRTQISTQAGAQEIFAIDWETVRE